jgi:hypothetical protein
VVSVAAFAAMRVISCVCLRGTSATFTATIGTASAVCITCAQPPADTAMSTLEHTDAQSQALLVTCEWIMICLLQRPDIAAALQANPDAPFTAFAT